MLAALITAVLLLGTSAPADSEISAQTRELLGDRAVQKELPNKFKKAIERGQNDARQARERRQRREAELRRRRQRRQRSEHFGSSLGRGALYIVMAVVLAIVLFWLLRGSMGYESDHRVAEAEAESDEADRGVVERPLGDAEALASSGRFADAVHTLLLKTLMELAMKRGQPLQSSLTSREIVARVGLPDSARAALTEIVDVVEISHFGDLPIGENEYRKCLDSYSRFSAAYLRGNT
jgi:hypothetical protein